MINYKLLDYDKNKDLPYLQYWDVKLPVNNYEWVTDTSQFNEDLIKKTIVNKVMTDIFVKLMLKLYHLYLKKLNMLYT